MTRCHADRLTGALRIVGAPGGLFHLRDGAVVAVDTPGSPGAEALLLCSGRISEEDWIAALRASAGPPSPQAALVARGTVGPTELRVLVVAATQDGVFAIAAGDIEQYVADDGKPVDALLPTPHGIGPDLLLRETSRRLDALASLPFPISPYRERVVPAHRTAELVLTAGQREIVTNATGRRNARDIAFAVGRSVYSVTAAVSRMVSEDVLAVAPAAAPVRVSYRGAAPLRPRASGKRLLTSERNHGGP